MSRHAEDGEEAGDKDCEVVYKAADDALRKADVAGGAEGMEGEEFFAQAGGKFTETPYPDAERSKAEKKHQHLKC